MWGAYFTPKGITPTIDRAEGAPLSTGVDRARGSNDWRLYFAPIFLVMLSYRVGYLCILQLVAANKVLGKIYQGSTLLK